MKDEIILIDGKMMAYRAHFSHAALKNADGEHTGLLHGFLWEMLRINKKSPKAAMVICWDGVGMTWRHKLYPQYKAQRKLNPDWQKMQDQTKVLLPMLYKLGFHVLRREGIEADDLIGILTNELMDCYITIYSADKDMYQLLQADVRIWPKFDQPLIRKDDVEKRIGAPLNALLEIKAMAGDPADNLKGLPGVGMKTAVKMWKSGRGLESLYVRAKYKDDYERVQKERQVGRIIPTTNDLVWTADQKFALEFMARNVNKNPWRSKERAENHRTEFYKFLGRYGLNELFVERHKFFDMP